MTEIQAERMHEILCQVWNREISADEGMEMIEGVVDTIEEYVRMYYEQD